MAKVLNKVNRYINPGDMIGFVIPQAFIQD